VPGILVIEDNAANLELMLYLLNAFGHTASAACDGEEGFEKAMSEDPDLIVCDIQLPKLDGYGVLRKLREDPALRSIPVIAVTALAMVGDRDRVLSAGFDGYLTKPIDPEIFVGQLDPWLRGPSTAPKIPEWQTSAGTSFRGHIATVLVSDNVPNNLELARSILEPNGYRVITASGTKEAIEKACLWRPDLILSDVRMGDSSGYDFIGAVKADANLSEVPFIFITSSEVEEPSRLKGLALGAARFLVRPMEPARLLAEIAACLAERDRRG